MHRIQPGNPRTAILRRARRTPIGAGALLRRIGDEVALAVAAVPLEDVQQPAAAAADARWQRALPQDAARQVRLEVDVQGRVGALAQRLFHREVVGVGGAEGPMRR